MRSDAADATRNQERWCLFAFVLEPIRRRGNEERCRAAGFELHCLACGGSRAVPRDLRNPTYMARYYELTISGAIPCPWVRRKGEEGSRECGVCPRGRQAKRPLCWTRRAGKRICARFGRGVRCRFLNLRSPRVPKHDALGMPLLHPIRPLRSGTHDIADEYSWGIATVRDWSVGNAHSSRRP